MRRILPILILALSSPASAQFQLNFDEVGLGTVLNTHYEARGVVLTGIGNGGPFDVVADEPCGAVASAPHVLSLRAVESCPEVNDGQGWFRVDFTLPQTEVSVVAVAASSGGLVYLKAFDGSGFLDQKMAGGSGWDGSPLTLTLVRQPGDPPLTRVEFGTLGGTATFDDLGYGNRPVAVERSSWSRVKSRY